MTDIVGESQKNKVTRRDFLRFFAASFGLVVAGSGLERTINNLSLLLNQQENSERVRSLKVREAMEIVEKYKGLIFAGSEKENFPPEIMASVVATEQIFNPNLTLTDPEKAREINDRVEVAVNPRKASIGITQVNLQSALELDNSIISPPERVDKDPQSKIKAITQRLNTPWWNMVYFSKICALEMAEYTGDFPNRDKVYGHMEKRYADNPQKLKVFRELEKYYSGYFDKRHDGEENAVYNRCSLEEAIHVWDEYPEFSHLFQSNFPIDYFVIHHTASSFHNKLTITAQHLSRGFGDIGYNGLIGNGRTTEDGKFYPGRSPKEEGAHTLGLNTKSLGIALVGDFTLDKPSEEQIKTLTEVSIACARVYLLTPDKFIGHKDKNETECPGANFDLQKFREGLV
jgi:N-acetylmuramoyl-L-alanine amidase